MPWGQLRGRVQGWWGAAAPRLLHVSSNVKVHILAECQGPAGRLQSSGTAGGLLWGCRWLSSPLLGVMGAESPEAFWGGWHEAVSPWSGSSPCLCSLWGLAHTSWVGTGTRAERQEGTSCLDGLLSLACSAQWCQPCGQAGPPGMWAGKTSHPGPSQCPSGWGSGTLLALEGGGWAGQAHTRGLWGPRKQEPTLGLTGPAGEEACLFS